MELIGKVEGKNVIIVDDMVDTAGTLVKAAEIMLEKGAIKVYAIATHPILSGAAHERIRNSKLEALIVTDTIPIKEENYKIKIVPCDTLFADVMHKVHNNISISGQVLM